MIKQLNAPLYILLVVALSLNSVFALAADVAESSDEKKADTPPIYYSTAKHEMIAKGKVVTQSFWAMRADYGDTFKDNPAAQKEYERYEELIAWAPYLNWGSVVVSSAYGFTAAAKGDFSAGTMLGIFLVPWLTGIFVAGSAIGHLQKAVNLENGVPPTEALNSRERTSPRDDAAVVVPLLSFAF